MPSPTVIQSSQANGSGNVNAPALITANPTVGNLIVIGINSGTGTSPVNANVNGWTCIGILVGFAGALNGIGLYYRYVQAGDTKTYAGTQAVGFSGNGCGYCMWEIAGSLTSGNPVDVQHFDDGVMTTTNSSTAIVSTAANELALCYGGCQSSSIGPGSPSVSGGGFTPDQGSGYGFFNAGGGGHLAVPTSGTSVSATITWNNTPNGTLNYYIGTILLKSPVSANPSTIVQTFFQPTQTGVLAESDTAMISQTLFRPTQAGVLADKDTAMISQTLARATQAGVLVEVNHGAIVQTLAPVTQSGVLAEKDMAMIVQTLSRVTQLAHDTIEIAVINQTLHGVTQLAALTQQSIFAQVSLNDMLVGRVTHGHRRKR